MIFIKKINLLLLSCAFMAVHAQDAAQFYALRAVVAHATDYNQELWQQVALIVDNAVVWNNEHQDPTSEKNFSLSLTKTAQTLNDIESVINNDDSIVLSLEFICDENQLNVGRKGREIIVIFRPYDSDTEDKEQINTVLSDFSKTIKQDKKEALDKFDEVVQLVFQLTYGTAEISINNHDIHGMQS